MSPFMGSGGGPGGLNAILGTIFTVLLWTGAAVYIGYRLYLAVMLRNYLVAVPEQFRTTHEAIIWMGVIPGVPVLVNFFIFPSLAKSYRNAFEAERLGDIAELKRLNLLAWSYCVLYLLPFTYFVAPGFLEWLFMLTSFAPILFLLLLCPDIVVLSRFIARLDLLKQNLLSARGIEDTAPVNLR